MLVFDQGLRSFFKFIFHNLTMRLSSVALPPYLPFDGAAEIGSRPCWATIRGYFIERSCRVCFGRRKLHTCRELYRVKALESPWFTRPRRKLKDKVT